MMLYALVLLTGCDHTPTTDEKQAAEQAAALEQAHAQIGMPAINDFSEKRMMKDLYEMRDKPFPTHTYILNEVQGCLIYLGPSVGFGLPYATQYTSPTRAVYRGNYVYDNVPQAEPNGLFMPSSAEGTWVMLKSPTEEKVQPVYIEPRVIVSPFRLVNAECATKTTVETPSQKQANGTK
jgi:hypothetical protein